jgi:hypothetical protein
LRHGTLKHQAKLFFYASGWKKFEAVWDLLIRTRQLARVTPLLEGVLSRVTGRQQQPGRQSPSHHLPVIQPETIELGKKVLP